MNDEQLRAAYGRLDGALNPPGDASALVARRVAVRRHRRTAGVIAAGVVAVLAVAGIAAGPGCGDLVRSWAAASRRPASQPAEESAT